MPRLEEINPNNQTNSADQPTSTPVKKEDSGLIKTIGQLLPFAPLVFEQFTGQKIPAMSGTMAEIQLALTNLQTGLQTVVNNQQQLAQRLVALETNANNHLTNLTHQFNSLRLTHTQEKKQIEFNPHPKLETENY